MTTSQWILTILAASSVVMWLVEWLALEMTRRTMPLISEMPKNMTGPYPKISIIIPACNEGETIEKAVSSRLEDTYPNLEFVLIDDRSTDNTREIIRDTASRDSRVKAVYIDELPVGWLGKVHALHQGVKHATGEWILFSDADVHMKPGSMNKVVSYCISNKLSHLAVLPQFNSASVLMDAAVTVFVKALIIFGRSWKIKDPDSRAFAGAGAFNMVRREDFLKTKGFEWLKMEVVDDLTLGQMMKHSGFRSDMLNGRGTVEVRWYNSFPDMKKGVGRAIFAGIGFYRVSQTIGVALVGYFFDMLPYAFAFIPMGMPWLQVVGIGVSLFAIAVNVKSARLVGLPVLPALLLPLGNTVVMLLTLRAGIVGGLKKGITWRGTFYSNKELREGRRFMV